MDAINSAIWDSNLTPTQKLILLALARHRDRGFPGITALSKMTGVEYQEVCRTIRHFEFASIMVWDTPMGWPPDADDCPYRINIANL